MPYYDTVALTSPVFQHEVFSNPIEGTNDLMVAETYIQLRTSYSRQAVHTGSSRYGGYYLVDESVPEHYGAENSTVVRFTRTYAQIPASRNETAVTIYSYPGLSGSSGASWQRYYYRRPITLQCNATDAFSYYHSTDGSTSLPSLTIPKLASQPVDFFGAAYDTTPPYASLGSTTPISEPSTYVVSASISRWKGEIWQKIVRTVPYPATVIS